MEKPVIKFGFPLKADFHPETVYSVEVRTADSVLVDLTRCGSPKLEIGLTVKPSF